MVVLVTGCRSGFGKLIAETAARRGHVVYAGFRRLVDAEPFAEAWAGLPIRPVALDVTSAADREAVVKKIVVEAGRIDGLVNNAGIAMGGFLETIDEDEIRKVFETNVFGLWALTKAVLPTMRAQKHGVVVNISSMSGRMAFPGLGVYASSKFALEGMSEAWRHELRPFGIRVVLVEPGAFKTDIFGRNRTIGRRAGEEGPYKALFDKLNGRFAEITERQSGDPQVVADKVALLLEASRSDFRYPLGKDAKLRLVLKTVLPFPVLERVLDRVLRG